MALTNTHAEQIAALLNDRNQLTRKYTEEKVLTHADDYLVRVSDTGQVIACVEVKSVQWYQCEILHLTVAAAYANKGHGKALLCEAERSARTKGARILQCTIRAGNEESRSLFEWFGFVQVSNFYNQSSGNNIIVLQKVLASAR